MMFGLLEVSAEVPGDASDKIAKIGKSRFMVFQTVVPAVHIA